MKKIETREHVQAFLNSFLPKFDIWGIFFIDRKKNDEAIAALGITPAQREDVIRNIEANDYIETIVDENLIRRYVGIRQGFLRRGIIHKDFFRAPR